MRLIIAIFSLFFIAVGFAEEEKKNSMVVLPKNAVHEGDYFAWGNFIEISGIVKGDVYASGGQVFIDGIVEGDVLAVGGSIQIAGQVQGNIRLIGGQVLIGGKVGKNATVISGNTEFLQSASIGQNVVAIAGNMDVGATVSSDATLIASNLRVSGTVQKMVHAYVGQIRFTSRAFVGGDVEYASNNLARMDAGAHIGGQILHHPSFFHDIIRGNWLNGILLGSKLAAILMNFLYTFVIGVILLRLFPANLEAALLALKQRPWKAFACGIMLLILLPLASVILLISILGAPFALTLIAANIIGFYTAKIYVILWVSNTLFTRIGFKPSKIPLLCMGLITYFIFTSIPIVGTIIAFAALLFGLGAGALAQVRHGILQK